jgi:hypothetical protein
MAMSQPPPTTKHQRDTRQQIPRRARPKNGSIVRATCSNAAIQPLFVGSGFSSDALRSE